MSVNTYQIEHKILTLAKNAVPDREKNSYSSFSADNIAFEHWEFNIRYGWLEDAWLAKAEVSNSNFLEAINVFRKKLWKIIPRIALISQSYIEYHMEPFVVYKNGNDIAFFQNINDRESGGLMFMEKEKKALDELLSAGTVPDEFFFYWNDAVNTIGYSAKLLLMFSALEALVKKPSGKDWDLLKDVLGEDLKKDLFGTKEQPNVGLRHRLVHGEYFSPDQDRQKNYLDLIHKRVMSFFNNKILTKPLIQEDVVSPQRHFYGGKSEWNRFIKKVDNNATFKLKDILVEVKNDPIYAGFRDGTKYEMLDASKCNELLKVY